MKIRSLIKLGMLSAMFTACSSDTDSYEDPTLENKIDISFVAGMPGVEKGTRTSFDVTTEGQKRIYTPLWSSQEQMSVIYDENKAVTYKGLNTDYAKTAQFQYTGSTNPIKTGNTIIAVNKNLSIVNDGFIATHNTRGIEIGGNDDTAMSDTYTGNVITTSFKSAQIIAGGKKQQIDETSEILVSKPVHLEETTTYPVKLQFKRYNGIICINVLSKDDAKYPLGNTEIKEIQLTTCDAANDFGGDVNINVSESTLGKFNGRPVTVKGDNGASIGTVGKTPVYMSVLPTTIKSGSSFKIYFQTTDGRTYERILKAPSKDVVVAEGKVSTFNVSFGDKNLKVMLNPKTKQHR